MTTRRILVPLTAVAGLCIGAWVPAAPDLAGERPDCPGKIICPQTGELICRDQCPTVDPQRPDCPGRIVCPLTGELVCKDRCPLSQEKPADSTDEQIPACCRGG